MSANTGRQLPASTTSRRAARAAATASAGWWPSTSTTSAPASTSSRPAGTCTAASAALRLTIVRRPVPDSTVTAETGGGPGWPGAASSSVTWCSARSARIRSPSGCAPTADTSVTRAPSAAAVTAALAAGPPAAISTASAWAFSSTPGTRSTR
jgi:hypothetical protein